MKITARWKSSISQILRSDWQTLTEVLPTPILDWEWLRLLEDSGSISPATGWSARHLTLWRGSALAAVAPLYIKTHSLGEFVYDWGFADAAERINHSWYPKLVGMSPATPSVGYRFLISASEDPREIRGRLLEEIDLFCLREGIKSLQLNFVHPEASSEWGLTDFSVWKHQSFLWENEGWPDFEAFLGIFDKNQRRNIRREGESLKSQGIRIRMVEGPEIPAPWFRLMGELYDRTNRKFGPWAARFLHRDFFESLEILRPLLVFGAAFEGESPDPFALSFFLRKGGTLIGRYWGSLDERKDLYFNLCYYEPLRWAIDRKIALFDPGAGSNLKIRRGFKAVENHSLHRFYEPRLKALFDHHIGRLNLQEQSEIAALNEARPIKRQAIESSENPYG